MAKRKKQSAQKKQAAPGNTSSIDTNSFTKGMNKDVFASFEPKTSWSHARNAYNNSVDGDFGVIGNEPANLECGKIPYPVIGTVHKIADQWIIFSTNDIKSEIGIFDDSKCEYTTIVNDDCLKFNRKYLITGASKENFDCTWQVYFDDGNNPSRSLNIDRVPYEQIVVSAAGADCILYVDGDNLDCEKIRLAPILDTPCLKLTRGQDGGQLRNGTYQAYVAYVENDQRVTDYISASNLQAIFNHQVNGGALSISISNLDKDYEFYELVILSDNQGAKVAKKLGVYSTEQEIVYLDFISPETTTVALSNLFLRSPAYERSQSMYVVNDWLIRQGPTEQFDFNYQPLANNIKANWTVAEYPATYYNNGGNAVGFLRDEQYTFFIRWIYNTGEKSASYHIPGRAPKLVNGEDQYGNAGLNELNIISGTNTIDGPNYLFQVYNTATVEQQNISEPTGDGGIIIGRGKMGYWQSTEKYPATQPDIWADLCGKEIRHHKFPTEEKNDMLHLSSNDGDRIRMLGVEFSGIQRPLDNNGNIIENIVGYEILRGSREGNKSILAKGVIRNMRKYDIPDYANGFGPKQGLYANFPYNDLRGDVYHHNGKGTVSGGGVMAAILGQDPFPRTDGCEGSFSDSKQNFPPLSGYTKDVFTFHSPDLLVRNPFLNAPELRLYGALSGNSVGHFIKSENHPQIKLIRNLSIVIAGILGVGYAIQAMEGRKNTEQGSPGIDLDQSGTIGVGTVGPLPIAFNSDTPGWSLTSQVAVGIYLGISTVSDIIVDNLISDAGSLTNLWVGDAVTQAIEQGTESADRAAAFATPGLEMPGKILKTEFDDKTGSLPTFVKAITAIMASRLNISTASQEIVDLIYNLVSFEDFAFKHNSHGFMNDFHKTSSGSIVRSKVLDSSYIGSSVTGFTPDYKVNNLNRPDTVLIRTEDELENADDISGITDISRYVIGGDADSDFGNQFIIGPEVAQTKTISMNYAALKFKFANQYGQLRNIKQTPMPNCLFKIDNKRPASYLYSTDAIFRGDTYVGRYTEKVIMPIFSDFLLGQPDGFPYNYLQRQNIPYPRFWFNSRKFDTSAFADKLVTLGISGGTNWLPNDLFYLDRGQGTCFSGALESNNTQDANGDPVDTPGKGSNPLFAMRYAYMYTHCNGILDYFTESEINLAYRDWVEDPGQRYYDTYRYNNTDDLFEAPIIKVGNSFKYDYSLSASRFITNLTSSGSIQEPDYDPQIAETCFSEYPKRLIYSLQAQEESKKDFWRVYLANNYRDFKNQVNVIKPINKSGAIIFFPYQSPQMFQGVDTLKTTDLGTKITIGDGGLFSQPFQNLVNSDSSNEYGSCESQRGIINTPYGFFFISQAQGKVFQQSGQGLNPISNSGMKWWFAKYLPSILLRQFPELEYSEYGDNPVVGIGCQVIFDITDDVVYFCKRDFKVKDEFLNQIAFDAEEGFTIKPIITLPGGGGSISSSLNSSKGGPNILVPKLIGNSKIEFGDPRYFDDVSWTVSYDPKNKAWISFHDWHPELCMPSVNHFLTTKTEVSEDPICPPDYTYNPGTKQCERLIQEQEAAIVAVDEIAATIGENAAGCPIDIVFALDASGSTITAGGPTNPASKAYAEILFVKTFLENPIIVSGMQNGYIQIGVTLWAGPNSQINLFQALNLGGSGEGMLSSVTPSQAVNNIISEWTGGGTDVAAGLNHAISVIQDKASSQLGDRTAVTGFKEFLFMVPDGTGGPVAPDGCPFQSNTLSGATGNPYSFVYGVFATNDLSQGTNLPPPGTSQGIVLNQITCNKTAYQFVINTNNLSEIDNTVDDILSETCSTPSCECPEGYTLVYDNDADGQYTDAEGECDPQRPPICRKVTCDCPEPPIPEVETTQSGECDNLYLAGPLGDPNYINTTPLICSYYALLQEAPNFIAGGIWRHNYRCDLYANYYGTDYPWELEFIEGSGQMVNTIRSLEYQLEAYIYKGDLHNGCGDDRWHDLDFNFDELIIYNSEQVSGLLRLNLNPKEDPIAALAYPVINANDIDILYSKEEQKYRINQFWDITNDRGEFTNSEQQIHITQLNGYIRDLNTNNLDYDKQETQRKKFRHYYNKVLLRRRLSNDRKMLLKLSNTKLNISYR